MRIALVAILANLVGNLTLIWWFQHVGIALATALSAWLNVGLLWLYLHKRRDYHADPGVRRTVPRMVAAALLMAVVLWFASAFVMPYTQGPGVQRLAALGLLVGGGVAVYFGAGLALGAYDPRQLLTAFRRGTA
jgi:putative peptidoglycan lipid II flippase